MSIRLRCHALMLMLCLGFSGCTPTAETQMDEQRNPHFLAGREKVGALDYKGAVESFERAVEDNPRSALAHFELGVLYERENDYVAALYHFNKALKLRPNGNPADIIRQRIPGCKQELVKADSLAIINPNVLRETENLRAQNATLRSQLEMLQAQLASRPPTPITGAPATAGREATTPPVYSTPPTPTLEQNGAPRVTITRPPAATASRGRTHTVRAGETVTSIAKQYSVKANALLAANPGLDARRMRIGQTLTIPVP